MKKIVSLFCVLLCIPAFASESPYDTYAGFRIHKNESLAFKHDTKGGHDVNIRKDNFGFGGVVGNKLTDYVKVEFETSYTGLEKNHGNNSYDFDVWSNMFNMYLFKEYSGVIAPYVGLGVGFATVWSDINTNLYSISDTTFDLSYQIMFGVNFALNNRIDFNLGCKYQYYGDIEHESHGRDIATTTASGTEVYFGAVYKFGL